VAYSFKEITFRILLLSQTRIFGQFSKLNISFQILNKNIRQDTEFFAGIISTFKPHGLQYPVYTMHCIYYFYQERNSPVNAAFDSNILIPSRFLLPLPAKNLLT